MGAVFGVWAYRRVGEYQVRLALGWRRPRNPRRKTRFRTLRRSAQRSGRGHRGLDNHKGAEGTEIWNFWVRLSGPERCRVELAAETWTRRNRQNVREFKVKLAFSLVYDWRLACSFPGRAYHGGTARWEPQPNGCGAGVYLIRLALGWGRPRNPRRKTRFPTIVVQRAQRFGFLSFAVRTEAISR